jgi:5-methylcytosine-specific restriction endonuclease McrA
VKPNPNSKRQVNRRNRNRAAKAANRTYRAAQRKVHREFRAKQKRDTYGPRGRPAPVVVRFADPEKPAREYKTGAPPGTYQAYLSSAKWRRLRNEVLLRDKHRCVKCHWNRDLHVHHLTYERMGDELLEDLVTLCARCHGREHLVAA